MAKYTEGVCGDGAGILKDGELITIEQVLKELNEAQENAAPVGQVNELVRPRCKACGKYLPHGGSGCHDCDDIDW